MKINIDAIKRIHFTGIKGVGMTALAIALRDLGKEITGDDTEEVFVTDDTLANEKILWNVGFSSKFLQYKPDLLIATAAHGGLNNPEVIVAKEKGIPVITYAQGLAMISKKKKLLTVCGVGGKTTISSMLAVILTYAGLNPSFVVGVGNIYPINKPGKYSENGKYFICESDEYAISPGVNNNPKFSLLDPDISVVTNVEHDHPDIYKNIDETKIVFKKFLQKSPLVVAYAGNKNTLNVIKGLGKRVITYGKDSNADYQLQNMRIDNSNLYFSIYSKKEKMQLVNIKLAIPGEYNALNALAAFIVAKQIGVETTTIKHGLEGYLGCRRRIQFMGKYFNAGFYDDYAHHPSEIQQAINAVKLWHPDKKLITIFQPHTYSRTKALLDDFSASFRASDAVVVIDIYSSAREEPDPTISSKLLTEKIKKHSKAVYYIQTQKELASWLKNKINDKYVVLTLGAGDIFHLYNLIKQY